MPPRSPLSSAVLACAAAILFFATPMTAQAQTLSDLLWGGGQEWGGSRQTVSFNPKYTPGQIIVSFGDRRLYHIISPGTAISYPIAVPREQSRWEGTTRVSSKRPQPSWRPTPEMLAENPRLPRWVPGGHPMNPLGVRALYLGSSMYRIHGTDAPWTIGKAVSKGCIRMFNEDVLHLYPRVEVGTKVVVTWQRFNPDTVAASSSSGYFSSSSSYDPMKPKTYKPRSVANKPVEVRETTSKPTVAVAKKSEPAAPKTKSVQAEKPVVSSAKAETKPAPHKASTLGVRAGASAVPGGSAVIAPDKSAKAAPTKSAAL